MKKFFKSLFKKETWNEFWIDADKVLVKMLIAVVSIAAVVGILYLTVAK